MRRLFFIVSILLPLAAMAQSTWELPEDAVQNAQEAKAAQKAKEKAQKKSKADSDAKYLKGAVTEVNGKVQWTLETDAPGKSADEIYELAYGYLKELTSSENQLLGSQIALVNKNEHSIIATVKEWIDFKKNFISHDRAATSYVVTVECTNGHLKAILNRIIFDYSENDNSNERIRRAEDWITDKEALNKNGTKLYPGCARFRRKMCDRKDEVFAGLENCLRK